MAKKERNCELCGVVLKEFERNYCGSCERSIEGDRVANYGKFGR